MSNYQSNRAKLNGAYIKERALGYPWHQIAIFLKEKQRTLDYVLTDDGLTDELISRLPEYRTEDKFNYDGTGKVIPTSASESKQEFYNTEEWKELKKYIWDNTPGAKVCPYCGLPIVGNDWTIHHQIYTESDMDRYKNDRVIFHYTILHLCCHKECHNILKTSKDKEEILKLGFMGRHWLQNALNRFLD